MSAQQGWPSPWPAEDGGPRRLQAAPGHPGLAPGPGEELRATSRDAVASTMAVLRDPGEAYLLCHTAGDDSIAWVERFDPETLEVLERSPDLPGGPTWPGGMAAHADGGLHVVFGRHAHRLGPDASLQASRELPVDRPYNSFVTLPDGHLVTKPFGGPAAPAVTRQDPVGPAELLVLDPVDLEVVARLVLPEPSVARLSASGDDVYAVGDDALHRIRWDGRRLVHDEAFSAAARYRTLEGQTFGWDAVIGTDAAWFLDDGEGTEDYAGTLQGCGRSGVPLHLVRVDLATGAVDLHEVSGLPGGIVANPPALVEALGVVVAYDSGNGRVVAFDIGSPDDAAGTAVRGVRWQRDLGHGSHPLVLGDAGQIVLADHDPATGEQAVVVDLATGEERARVATGSPVQSVLFPAAGFGRDAYLVSFTTLTRIWVA